MCDNNSGLKNSIESRGNVQIVCDKRPALSRAAEVGTSSAVLRTLNRLRWKLEAKRKEGYAGSAYSPKTFTIGVGNIAFGGSGKTPMAIKLGKLFLERGLNVAVVVKHMPQKRLVAVGSKRASFDSNRIGDEALLLELEFSRALAEKDAAMNSIFKVMAAHNKVEAVRLLDEEDFDAIIVDDALALTGLTPHVNLALVAPADLGVSISPAALLREPPETLRRATHIFISNTDERISVGKTSLKAISNAIEQIAEQPVFAAIENKLTEIAPLTTVVRAVRDHLGEPVLDTADIFTSVRGGINDIGELLGKQVLTVASIARPERFEQAIIGAGVARAYIMRFADHYRLRTKDIRRVYKNAIKHGADAILTTMKDAMRIAVKSQPLAKLSNDEAEWLVSRCYVAKFDLIVNPPDAFEILVAPALLSADNY